MNNDEVIFNLFLIEYWSDYTFGGIYYFNLMNKSDYDWNTQLPVFVMLKSCFPENEVCPYGLNHIEE
jgi:hypothetical protein